MAFRAESEKVAKMTRAMIDNAGRRVKSKNLAFIYAGLPEALAKTYIDITYNILTDFPPGKEMQDMISILLLHAEAKIDINEDPAFRLYYGYKMTLLARKVSSLTNLSKVAFMEQETMEDKEGDTSLWDFS